MTVGFCLSGGGSRGAFEVGALRLLHDRGIQPKVLASTSVGSVNAVKLAEGDDLNDPSRGLLGLEGFWMSMSTDSSMYSREDWLSDPDLDPAVRGFLLGEQEAPLQGPLKQDGRWGDLDPLVDQLYGGIWLMSTGAALLKSLNVIANKAKSLYNLDPIRDLLHQGVNLDAIKAWSDGGGRWRMAVVSLESGRLRYVTESGQVIERDGTPVQWAGPLSPECQAFQDEVTNAEAGIRSLQLELSSAAPGERPALVKEIREAKAELGKASRAFGACRAAQPMAPLVVDIRDGVLASASMPAIFRSVTLGDETYVDGGLREVIPVQAALDAGATEVYAISASPIATPKPARASYRDAGIVDVIERSLLGIMLTEVVENDLNPRRTADGAEPSVRVIAPDEELYSVTTIDPGLIQINRDYGWMRASDVLDGIAPGSRRWQLATEIALVRLDTWLAEIQFAGREDPTRKGNPAPKPDPDAKTRIDQGKQKLKELLDERQKEDGPLPPGIGQWVAESERHPWQGSPSQGGGLTVGSLITEAGTPVQVVVSATDSSLKTVDGEVIFDGAVVGRTNIAFEYTFATRLEWVVEEDPNGHPRRKRVKVGVAPNAIARVNGYADTPISVSFTNSYDE